MVEDTPDDYVHDFFNELVWPDDSLGRPVLGTVKSINSLSREDMTGYMRDRYIAGDVIVSASGSIKHHELVKLFSDNGFASLKPQVKSKGYNTPDFPSKLRFIRRNLSRCIYAWGLAPSNRPIL